MSEEPPFVLPGSLSNSPSKSSSQQCNEEHGAGHAAPAIIQAQPVTLDFVPVRVPGRKGLQTITYTEENFFHFPEKKTRGAAFQFNNVPLDGHEENMHRVVRFISTSRENLHLGYGLHVKQCSYFSEGSSVWVLLVANTSLHFHKWGKVLHALKVDRIRICFYIKEYHGPTQHTLIGLADAFGSLTTVDEIFANHHNCEEIKSEGAGFSRVKPRALGCIKKRDPKRRPEREEEEEESPPAKKKPAPKGKQAAVLLTPETGGVARRALVVTPKSAPSKARARLDGAFEASALPFVSPVRPTSFQGPVDQLVHACVEFLSAPDLRWAEQHLHVLLEYLGKTPQLSQMGMFILSSHYDDMFALTVNMRQLVVDVLGRRYQLHPESLGSLDISRGLRAGVMDGPSLQLLHLIGQCMDHETSKCTFALFDKVSCMVLASVYIVVQHLDKCLSGGACKEQFLQSYWHGVTEMVWWLARISFHMNNFLVVQIRDGFLPPDMHIVLQAGLAEERIQMAFTEGYPEIQRHLAERHQELTKRSGRRKKFDAAVSRVKREYSIERDGAAIDVFKTMQENVSYFHGMLVSDPGYRMLPATRFTDNASLHAPGIGDIQRLAQHAADQKRV